MLQYDRNDEPAPACLSDERSREYRQVLRDIFGPDMTRSAQTRISMHRFEVGDLELDEALARLFNERCSFCESKRPVTPYRFRPVEEAGPSDAAPPRDADRGHLYYSWLVNSWRNIYAICEECRPRERSIFPMHSGRRCPLPTDAEIAQYAEAPTGTWRGLIEERAMFLDPCGREDLRRHLAALPDGELVALSARGEATIRHYNLDRAELVEARAGALRLYVKMLTTQADWTIFDFPGLEYGGSWFLLLYQVARKLGGGGGGRPILSLHRIASYYRERFRTPGFETRFKRALDDLRDRPGQIQPRGRTAPPLAGDLRPVAFEIRNFKSLEQLDVVLPSPAAAERDAASAPDQLPLAPTLVIIGENAAGKSSILEAMALALADKRARDDLPGDLDRFRLDPRLMGGGGRAGQRDSKVRVAYEDGGTSALRIGVAGIDDADDPQQQRVPVFAYGAFRMFLKADKRRLPSSNIRTLFDSSYVLPNPEHWLGGLHGKPLFNEVVRAIRSVLAIDQAFDTIHFDPATGQCELVVKTERPGGTPVEVRTPLASVSSGFRAVLSMICDVLRGLIELQGPASTTLTNARAVILIDEVEAHLHPRWKMRIIKGLREALPMATFVLTTHDPLCLRGLGSGEVMVLRRVQRLDGAPGLPEYVEQLEELPAIGTLTIEQLLTSDLFQLFSTDAPETEASLAGVGDILARSLADEPLKEVDAKRLAAIRTELRTQVQRAMPIGSTEVERLIQEAVEQYLVERRATRASDMAALRAKTRDLIVERLKRI